MLQAAEAKGPAAMLAPPSMAKVRRLAVIAVCFGAFCLLNYKLFVSPARRAAARRAVGKPPLARVIRDGNGPPPGFEFDPRLALSERELLQDIFDPGYNLTKQMMKHAWEGYRKFAWGHDELRPVDKNGCTGLGKVSIALTMIDSLDTLMLMNMQEEFLEARDYIFDQVSFDQDMNVSMFELNIRVIGGFLSAFALSGDGRFVSKAFDVAQRCLANFEHVFPDNNLNLMKRLAMSDKEIRAPPKPYTQPTVINVAQVGTLSMEFGYLSHIIKDPIFKERAEQVIKALSEMTTTIPGLYPITLHAHEQKQPDAYYSVGGMADSFYEYLFKYWLMTNKKDELHLRMWKDALEAIKKHLVMMKNKRYYIVLKDQGTDIPVMEHLACFLPGTMALHAYHVGDDETLALAAELASTCYEMYRAQATGISPEKCQVPSLAPVEHQKHYLLRPEVVESIFLLWRVTRDPKYRRWGYEIALAIEKHCKIENSGYAGVADVSAKNGNAYNDRQESFFLAETLKYLFLLFGPDDVLSIDKWVFNTEAHPFPIIQGYA